MFLVSKPRGLHPKKTNGEIGVEGIQSGRKMLLDIIAIHHPPKHNKAREVKDVKSDDEGYCINLLFWLSNVHLSRPLA